MSQAQEFRTFEKNLKANGNDGVMSWRQFTCAMTRLPGNLGEGLFETKKSKKGYKFSSLEFQTGGFKRFLFMFTPQNPGKMNPI